MNTSFKIVFNPLVQAIRTELVLAALQSVQQHRATKFMESPFMHNNFFNDVSDSSQSTVGMLASIPVSTVHLCLTLQLCRVGSWAGQDITL